MSHYRAIRQFEVICLSPDTSQENDTARRRAVVTVLTITVVMVLLYLGVVRVLDLGSNDRALLLGVFLITIGGAVALNAITLEAMNRSARNGGR